MDALMGAMPPQMVERMGRMTGMAQRVVIAFIDGEPDVLAALVDRIGTWDDDPGRTPYPMPRFQFAIKQVVDLVNTYFHVAETTGGMTISNEALAAGARELIEQYVPDGHRDAALAVLREVPGGSAPMDLSGGSAGEPGPAELFAAAAAAAWLATGAGIFPAPQAVRLKLLRQVREAESMAIGAPARERIADVADQDALDLLAGLYDESYARLIPRSPSQRTPWEWDMLAILKAHLLETPASATTPEQAEVLKGRMLACLQAAAATPRQVVPPAARAKAKRAQPKRKKPKGKR
ncbi:hypothetical protein ACFY1P_33200 [Streptomyces sp. NPDC001407]|uniref:hypothetical protein n=1 Tax=Streptomyces sp. NPDC001407 TaxID=3364573 RepID=UPI0036A088DE